MALPRQNEKKYHGEMVDIVNDDLGGYGHKSQRGFVKGIPDVELKVSLLPLVKIEVKHEVFMTMPKRVTVHLTELQRKRLRHMQKAKLSCGWAVFITVAKKTWVCYGTNPDAADFIVDANPGKFYTPKGLDGHYKEMEEWTKDRKIAVLSKMLNLLTRSQQFSQSEENSTEISPPTPNLLNV